MATRRHSKKPLSYTQFCLHWAAMVREEEMILARRAMLEDEFMDANGIPKIGEVVKDDVYNTSVLVEDRRLNVRQVHKNRETHTYSVTLNGKTMKRGKPCTSERTGVVKKFTVVGNTSPV